VNAGFVIGKAALLEQVYSWIVHESPFDDDQKSLSLWITKYGDATVALDTGSALVCNVNIFDGFGHLKTSCFHHFPGPLLKRGYFPQYNSACKKTLGVDARLIHPNFMHEALTFLIIFMCCSIFAHLVAKKNKILFSL
jgi:hypothetical protein